MKISISSSLVKKLNSLRIYLILTFIGLVACDPAGIKQDQYMIGGLRLYEKHCINCHNKDGRGLAKLIPPLASDYLVEMKWEELACQIRNGLKDTITVNGVIYYQEMPATPRLTPLEIAELVTYVKNTWGEQDKLYEVIAVEKALNDCR